MKRMRRMTEGGVARAPHLLSARMSRRKRSQRRPRTCRAVFWAMMRMMTSFRAQHKETMLRLTKIPLARRHGKAFYYYFCEMV